MSVFDWTKAVIETELYRDGNKLKPTKFIEDQIKLHTLNKLSGRIFNPVGLVRSISDSDNPFVNQLISEGVSDITGAGLVQTSDGKTFYRTADNNADELFFDDAREFKADIEGKESKTFLNAITRKAVDGLINRVGQLAGIEVKGTRSIMAQTLAYDASLIAGMEKGSQTKIPSLYSDDPMNPDQYVQMNPISDSAITYTHDILSFRSKIQELIKIKRKVADGFYAQNVAIKKSRDIIDIENNNFQRNISKKETIIDGIKNKLDSIIGQFRTTIQNEPTEYWVNRSHQSNKFSNRKFIGSGQYKLNTQAIDSYKSIISYILGKDAESYDNDPSVRGDYMDLLRDIMLTEITSQVVGDGEESDFLNIENRRLEKLKNGNYRRTITNFDDKKFTPLYTNISNKYRIGSEEFDDRGGTYSLYDRLEKGIDTQILDSVSESDVMTNLDSPDSDEFIFDDGSEASEHMYMSIQDVRNNHVIFLQPSIDNITEDTQPTYTDVHYVGRTESLPSYERTTRSINLSFSVSARTTKELLLMYKKINFIQGLEYPMITNNFRRSTSPIIRISIGDLYKNLGAYITSFSKSVDNNTTTWETENGYRVPKILQCSLSLNVIHDSMPYINGVYDFPDDVSIHNINV